MIGTALRPILYVEDSNEDFLSLRQALQDAGVRNPVQRCADSQALVAALGEEDGCAEAYIAAFILLDLNMPGVDGRDLLKQLRRRYSSVPIIVLSTSSDPEDIDFCYRAGANSYLVKPLEFEQLQQMAVRLAAFWLQTVALPSHGG